MPKVERESAAPPKPRNYGNQGVMGDLGLYDSWLHDLSVGDWFMCIQASEKCLLGPNLHLYHEYPNGRDDRGMMKIGRSPCDEVAITLAKLRDYRNKEKARGEVGNAG